MKTYFKSILITVFSLLSLFLFSCCEKEPVDEITYELTLMAIKSDNGSTKFTEIKYTDDKKVAQTITNSTSSFSTTFTITPNTVINFSVKGTASGGSATALPTPTIGYKIEKITNGKERVDLCNEFSASLNSSNGTYFFEKAFIKSFSGSTCN